MKINRLLFLLPVLFLFSCGNIDDSSGSSSSSSSISSSRPKGDEKIFTMGTRYIGIASGDIRVVAPKDSTRIGVNPFNTTIQGRLYYYDGDFDKEDFNVIQEDFADQFSYYHALSDSHYSYKQVTERDDRGNAIKREDIINLKYINEHPDEDIQVDPFLFGLIKESYDFTLNSSLRFNRFSLSLADLYEKKRGDSGQDALDKAFSLSANARFKNDFSKAEIETALKSVPQSVSSARACLSLDESRCTVRLNSRTQGDETYVPQRTLGGSAKGYATKKVADYFKRVYPSISLRINSGSSSILAIGSRPDDHPWKISYTNPVYREQLVDTGRNKSERYLEFSGSFNLSTSGYYEHYFYAYDKETNKILRRDHIINTESGFSVPYFDQVSVLIDDTGLADRYTTALRNTSSPEEAYSLFNTLNGIYGQEGELRLCYKGKKDDDSSLYSYSLEALSPLSSFGYPISVLNNGNEYDGDYSDISSYDIKSVKTKNTFSFSEVYLRSKKRFAYSHLFEEKNDTYFPYPDKAISVRKELK